jgi:hypothetical protein
MGEAIPVLSLYSFTSLPSFIHSFIHSFIILASHSQINQERRFKQQRIDLHSAGILHEIRTGQRLYHPVVFLIKANTRRAPQIWSQRRHILSDSAIRRYIAPLSLSDWQITSQANFMCRAFPKQTFPAPHKTMTTTRSSSSYPHNVHSQDPFHAHSPNREKRLFVSSCLTDRVVCPSARTTRLSQDRF